MLASAFSARVGLLLLSLSLAPPLAAQPTGESPWTSVRLGAEGGDPYWMRVAVAVDEGFVYAGCRMSDGTLALGAAWLPGNGRAVYAADVAADSTRLGCAEGITTLRDGRLFVLAQDRARPAEDGPAYFPVWITLNDRSTSLSFSYLAGTDLLGGRTPLPRFPSGVAHQVPLDVVAADSLNRALVLLRDEATGALVVARYTAEGRRDSSFGEGGFAPLPGSAGGTAGLRALPDGGVVVVEGTSEEPRVRYTVSRLDAAGAPVRAYGQNGRTTLTLSAPSVASIVGGGLGSVPPSAAGAVDAGGGIVLAVRGDVAAGESGVQPGLLLARLGPDGRPDPAFGRDGRAQLADTLGLQMRADGLVALNAPPPGGAATYLVIARTEAVPPGEIAPVVTVSVGTVEPRPDGRTLWDAKLDFLLDGPTLGPVLAGINCEDGLWMALVEERAEPRGNGARFSLASFQAERYSPTLFRYAPPSGD